MRRVLLASAVALLAIGVTGCSTPAKPAPAPVRSFGPVPPDARGGSCQLLDYAEVAQDLGITFDVAAAGQVDQTFTCVLEREGAPLPDLLLSIALVSDLDIPTFKSKVVPSGAAVIGDLGKIGYSRTTGPTSDAGPSAEVGWLAGNGRLIVLRCRLAKDAAPADATALVPKLVTLARRIDLTSI